MNLETFEIILFVTLIIICVLIGIIFYLIKVTVRQKETMHLLSNEIKNFISKEELNNNER
jgi:hypothetical protein